MCLPLAQLLSFLELCPGLDPATTGISMMQDLLVLAILTRGFLKLLARWVFCLSAPIADCPRRQFFHVRPKSSQATPTTCIEQLDPIQKRLLFLRSLPFFNQDTDPFGVASGPGPQPLRGMPGFPAQQQAQARNATLASTRLPNGKLGTKSLNR